MDKKPRYIAVRTFWLILIIQMPHQSCAQALMGARELAMGQAVTALPNSSWSVFANPAMVDQKSRSVSFFGVRYYGFADITDMAAVVTFPVKVGVLGFGVHRYGDDLFSENRLRTTFKNSFQGFHYGLAVNYTHVIQGEGYGSMGALGFDVGISARILEQLWIGAKATNINQPQYGVYSSNIEEEPPRELSIGLSYRLSDIALITSDAVKDVRFPLSYRAGLEITLFEELKGRAGITTEPQTFALGFGYVSEFWAINVGVQQHENPVLGISPGLDLNILW